MDESSPETTRTPFARLGTPDEAEATLRRLVDAFYDAMDARSEVVAVRAMHPADLAGSRDKLFWFLCGWSGGPQHYIARFGHPRLRARHLPFVIGRAESAQWLLCMRAALDAVVADEDLRETLWGAFRHIALHMKNASG
jgi:hemoglobin